MRKALAASLLSAFVFPGSGHYFLQRKKTGVLLMLATSIPMLYLIVALIAVGQRLFTLVQKQLLPPDFEIMLGYILSQPFGQDTQMAYFSLYAIFFLWLGAMLDAYRLGWREDMQTRNLMQNIQGGVTPGV
ncbi:hypothetical protein V8J88_12740 [Massilia sp. W12]|uniref:hypothetical protein n=1 Tax=Massilia sp. W12 TaxID=3126507 RepID=UPI0030CD54A7